MAKAERHRARARRSRRSSRPHARAPGAAGAPMFRIVVGAIALGSEEVRHRLDATVKTAPPAPLPGPDAHETAAQRAGYLAVGLAAEALARTARLARTLAGGGREVAAAVDAFARLPLVGTGVRPARVAATRTRRTVRALIARGRVETLEGRRLAKLLVQDTTARSVRDIAESAIKEVSHSREIAALVRAQSTGMVTDTLLEVRANSEQADDRLERRVRSWLRISRSGNGSDAAPAPLTAGKHPGG